MTLQSNSKLMKVVDEFADFDLLKPKAQPNPHFHTQETEAMFILTSQLKGYKRMNIKVERNEKWSRIKISGQKPFQESLMVGRKVVKKDIEMKGFQKWFKVPQGVIYDQVNARFNEDYSELMILMPKHTIGLTGARVDELKAEEIQAEPTKSLQIYTNEELSKQETQPMVYENVEDEFIGNSNSKEQHDGEKPKSPTRKFKICTPLMFGSTAFIMSLIVLAFHLVESKKQENPQKKKNEN